MLADDVEEGHVIYIYIKHFFPVCYIFHKSVSPQLYYLFIFILTVMWSNEHQTPDEAGFL
jgi:hypothetical protein